MGLDKREDPGGEKTSIPHKDPPGPGKSSSELVAHLPEELIFPLEGSKQ